jgi:hypothetical protein
MASYALLPAYRDFIRPNPYLENQPQLNPEGFKAFFSTTSGWGHSPSREN